MQDYPVRCAMSNPAQQAGARPGSRAVQACEGTRVARQCAAKPARGKVSTEDDNMMDVGFIGLGMMGSRIARNLVAAGFQPRVWNRTREEIDALVQLGARPAAEARDAFKGDVVFSMLADDSVVESVIGPLLDQAPRGLIHVNMATISVSLARDLAARHRQRGLTYVSATVFGRPELAAQAKLNIVVAGEDAAVVRIAPLLDVIGERTWRIGTEPERANIVKLAGNVMLGSAVETMSEVTAFASQHGIAPAALLDVLTNGVFASPAYKTYGTLIANRHYDPAGFRLSLLLKDVRLALAAADSSAVPMPIADVLHESLLDAVAHGDGERDVAALARVAMRRAKPDGVTQPA
jgi:3-hydroxyisobutyrate dehydrogenase-like beta-hydroxyacid dehydrogenase